MPSLAKLEQPNFTSLGVFLVLFGFGFVEQSITHRNGYIQALLFVIVHGRHGMDHLIAVALAHEHHVRSSRL